MKKKVWLFTLYRIKYCMIDWDFRETERFMDSRFGPRQSTYVSYTPIYSQ